MLNTSISSNSAHWLRVGLMAGLAVVLAWPSTAAAGLTLAGSVGSGWMTTPDSGRIATNIMLAPGFTVVGSFVRFELGLAADLPDIENEDFDVQVRPMLVVQPLPFFYGRATLGVTQLVNGPIQVALGAALGLSASLSKTANVFAEAGFVPRVGGDDDFMSIFEGRVGIGFGY
ncbi:MAG: hypothetical protein AAB426_06510 [Myxococcota bacterium]